MKDLNRKELIKMLNNIIKIELEKPDEEMDPYLIVECSDFLNELYDEEPRFSKEEVRQIINDLFERAEKEKQKQTENEEEDKKTQ